MPRSVACAVVRDDPPQVFIAEDQELYTERDVELAAQELEFTPLFKD